MNRLAMIFAGAWASGAMLLSLTVAAAEPAKVVVELFTSQGCYSCPPADVIAGELAERDDILPLSFHVTYWDRLGWPDTLGLPEGTARQETYAGYFGSGRIYTPQMVVHGRIDVVGSQRSRVMEAIEIMRAHLPEGPKINITGDRLVIRDSQAEPANVWLAAYDDVHDVTIERGENAGKTLRYFNSVRELIAFAELEDSVSESTLPLDRLRDEGRAGVAVLIQRKSDGSILSVADIKL